MNAYQKRKERARDEAVEWQNDFCNHVYSYGELAYYGEYFKKLAKRYGLMREFQENGIISVAALSTIST